MKIRLGAFPMLLLSILLQAAAALQTSVRGPQHLRCSSLRRPAAAEGLSAAAQAYLASGNAAAATAFAGANAALLAATGLTLAQTGGLAAAAAAGALATRAVLGRESEELRAERDAAAAEARDLDEKLQDEIFSLETAFEAQTDALRKQYDTTLTVRTDVLRSELEREKRAAIDALRDAQGAQLEEMRDYYTSQYTTKVAELQAELDAQAAELARFRKDAGFGDL